MISLPFSRNFTLSLLHHPFLRELRWRKARPNLGIIEICPVKPPRPDSDSQTTYILTDLFVSIGRSRAVGQASNLQCYSGAHSTNHIVSIQIGEFIRLKQRPVTSGVVCYRIELAVAKSFMPGLASQIPQLHIKTILPKVFPLKT